MRGIWTRIPTGVVTAAVVVALMVVGGPLVAGDGTPFALVVYVALSAVYAARRPRWSTPLFGLLWGVWAALFLPTGSLGWPLIAVASVIFMTIVVAMAKNAAKPAAEHPEPPR